MTVWSPRKRPVESSTSQCTRAARLHVPTRSSSVTRRTTRAICEAPGHPWPDRIASPTRKRQVCRQSGRPGRQGWARLPRTLDAVHQLFSHGTLGTIGGPKKPLRRTWCSLPAYPRVFYVTEIVVSDNGCYDRINGSGI
jgi:hypothetical protein